MKIFFDAKILSLQPRGGISRLVFELTKSFSEIKELEKIFYRGLYIDQYPFKKEWFKKYYGIRVPAFFDSRFVSFLDNMGAEMAYKFNASSDLIYHSFYHRIPKNPKGPVVVHVYDMIQELFYNSTKTIKFKKKSFDAADLIISISESTKKDLCELYPIDPKKVIVAYSGVNEVFLKDRISTKRANKRPYMLYIGSRSYSYKNFDLLLNTFIDKKYFFDFDLILAGGEKNLAPEQKEKIKNTVKQGSWLLQEFCDDEKLADLYSDASVFIYPSLYEGFGIPPLEAMARGCPVVASNVSSIPEVVGDAGLLFNPKDSDDLAQKIEMIINNKSTALNLIEKGKIRAKQFTWNASADTIYQGYLKLI